MLPMHLTNFKCLLGQWELRALRIFLYQVFIEMDLQVIYGIPPVMWMESGVSWLVPDNLLFSIGVKHGMMFILEDIKLWRDLTHCIVFYFHIGHIFCMIGIYTAWSLLLVGFITGMVDEEWLSGNVDGNELAMPSGLQAPWTVPSCTPPPFVVSFQFGVTYSLTTGCHSSSV